MLEGFEIKLEDNKLYILINENSVLVEGKIHFYLLNQKFYLKNITYIVIDLLNLNDINSSGISELITIYNHFKKRNPDTKYTLINVNEKVKNLLNLVNLADYMEIHYR